jgi:hypothetical protein
MRININQISIHPITAQAFIKFHLLIAIHWYIRSKLAAIIIELAMAFAYHIHFLLMLFTRINGIAHNQHAIAVHSDVKKIYRIGDIWIYKIIIK